MLVRQRGEFLGLAGCGDLNENGPYRLIGSATIWRCGLDGETVILGIGFEVLEAQARPSVTLLLLPADPDIEFSAPSTCVVTFPTMMIMD